MHSSEANKTIETTPLKVAIIEPVGGHSGMDYYDFGLCGGLAAAGAATILYTCDETTPFEKVSFQTKTVYKKIYGSDPAWQRGVRFLRGTIVAIRDAKRLGTQIAHFHFFHIGPLELFNVSLAKLNRMKVVVTIHDVESFVSNLTISYFAKRVYALVDQIIVHNQFSKAELIRVWHVPPEKVEVIAQGNQFHVADDKKEQTLARKYLNVPPNGELLLFFGQIKTVKGLDIFLKAMPKILLDRPNVHLLIAGRVWKDDFEKYQMIIDQNNFESACTCHIRFIPNEDVCYYFSAADLVILPYRNIYQSAVVLMGMSYGVPVLVSDLPAMAELITDGETGFLFKAGDSNALAEKVTQLLQTPELLKSVGMAGFELMRDQYSWKSIGAKTVTKYLDLLN